jgi:hypothetical protein
LVCERLGAGDDVDKREIEEVVEADARQQQLSVANGN